MRNRAQIRIVRFFSAREQKWIWTWYIRQPPAGWAYPKQPSLDQMHKAQTWCTERNQ